MTILVVFLLAATRMLAVAADLRQILSVPAIFAAIFVVSRHRATTTRMCALLHGRFICHHVTFFPEQTLMLEALDKDYARRTRSGRQASANTVIEAKNERSLFKGRR